MLKEVTFIPLIVLCFCTVQYSLQLQHSVQYSYYFLVLNVIFCTVTQLSHDNNLFLCVHW